MLRFVHCSARCFINRFHCIAIAAAAVTLAGCPDKGGTVVDTPTAESGLAGEDADEFDVAAVFMDDVLDAKLDGLTLPEVREPIRSRDTFTPPSLDELEAMDWTDRRVADGYEMLVEANSAAKSAANSAAESKESSAAVSIEQALAMKNDSPEANEQLVEAFGRFPDSPDEIDYDAEFIRGIGSDARSTNPLFISSVYDFEFSALTAFAYMGTDRNLQSFARADSVTSWKTSADQSIDWITLRDDLVWSDGEPITAHDIEFSFNVILDPAVDVPAVRSSTAELVGVKAYNDRDIVFFHEAAKATNVGNLSFPVLPQHIYEPSRKEDPTLQESARHVELEKNPVVGGPYEFRRRVIGGETLLTRRENYYRVDGKDVRRKPHFKTIRYVVVQDPNTMLLKMNRGEVDLIGLNPPQWDGQTGDQDFYERNTKLSADQWTYFYFGWNTDRPYFADRRVRRALSLAFDHKEFLENIGYGLYSGGRGPYHPDAWFSPDPIPEPLDRNLDAAEDLLAEAGWTDSDGDGVLDKDGVAFEFNLIFANSSPVAIRTVDQLTENLNQIGIRVNPKGQEFTAVMDATQNRDFDAMLGGWGAGSDPDSGKNIWTTEAIEGGRNYVGFSDEVVDQLYKVGAAEFDQDKRAKLYGRIAQILWAEQPYTFLYYRAGFFGMSKDLRGITFSPLGPLLYDGGYEALWKPKR